MFSCVILKNCKTIFVVNSKWVQILRKTSAKIINGALRPHQLTKIYIAQNTKANANFDLPARTIFLSTATEGVYWGYVLKTFGK